MKRISIYIVALIIVACSLALAAGKYKEGFNGFTWADPPEKIKAKYPKAKILEGRGLYVENEKLAGYPATLGFYFYKNQLSGAIVIFTMDEVRSEKYMDAFLRVESLLESKYGTDETKIRENEASEYLSDIDSIAMGRGVYKDIWNTGESLIVLMVEAGSPIRIDLTLFYFCNELTAESHVEEDKKRAGEL